jgi:hypothetical protein
MILLILILALKLVESKRNTGFLYSPITKSFICNDNSHGNKIAIPLKFVINVPENLNVTGNEKFTKDFDVVDINGRPGNGNKISINQKGEVKLYKNYKCETAYESVLKPETCSKDQRQIFIWVPERYLEDFSKMAGDNKSRTTKDVYKEKDDTADLKRKLDELKSLIQKKQSLPSETFNKCGNPIYKICKPKRREFSDSTNELYKHLYCLSSPFTEECQSYRQKMRDNRGMCLQRNVCVNHSRKNSCINSPKIQDSTKLLLKQLGLNSACYNLIKQVSDRLESKERLKKVKGILENIKNENNCNKECIKNPKNGMCLYMYHKNGGLRPIMKNEKWCKKKEFRKICSPKGDIESLICELVNMNSTDHFNRLLKDNESFN